MPMGGFTGLVPEPSQPSPRSRSLCMRTKPYSPSPRSGLEAGRGQEGRISLVS
jgi:hypothetical protein